ncbi:hypothetical protein SAMN05216419_103410 [Nitrosomonas cryotolerans]|nr:hypothetical protein SAMN05216419_103410 [Nitrosomonas cryotolerans]
MSENRRDTDANVLKLMGISGVVFIAIGMIVWFML